MGEVSISSADIIWLAKSRRLRWAGHVARVTLMWEKRIAYKVLVGEPERKMPFGKKNVNARIILKWLLKK
jgi:hypothetical protein